MSRPLRLAITALIPILAAAAVAVQRAHQLRPRDIPVLMYHNVLPGEDGGLSVWQVSAREFADQMDQLAAAGYSTILPHDIHRASRGLGWLPRKPVVITFDDGYEGVRAFAEPELAKHGFRAMCYLIADRLAGEGADRASFDSGPLLSTNEVAAMAARGTIAFGSHSLTHVRNPKLLAREIPPSRRRVRAISGVETRDYCYPFGLHGYGEMFAALREGGYETALVCGDRMFRYGTDTNLFAIPRLSVYGGLHDIALAGVDAAAGTVTLANAGTALPLKVRVVRDSDGRAWESGAQRVGDGRGAARSVVYRLPPEALAAPHRIEAWDAAGIFRYLPTPR